MKFWSNITYQKLSTGNAAEGSLIILKTIILSNQNNYMGLKYSMVKKGFKYNSFVAYKWKNMIEILLYSYHWICLTKSEEIKTL